MLGKESDLASRRALWQANYEVAELTGKVGKPEDALAAHRQVLAAREALAAESQADPEIKADVGRSLTAVAGLLEATGQTKEAEVTYRKAETLLVEAGPDDRGGRCGAGCPGELPVASRRLLHTTGRNDEALSVYRLARADQEALAAAPGATAESRRDLADTINGIAMLLADDGQVIGSGGRVPQGAGDPTEAGRRQPRRHRCSAAAWLPATTTSAACCRSSKPSEAEAEFRKALAIQQKLADDNPAVTEFRSSLAQSHSNLGRPAGEYGQVIGSGGRVPQGAGDPTEAGRRQPRRHRIPQPPGKDSHQPRLAAVEYRQASEAEAEYRKALAIAQKLADDNPAIPRFQETLATSLLYLGWQLAQAGKTDEAIGYYTREEAIRQKLAEASSATPMTGISWRTARPTRRTCSVGRGGLTRRSPHASARWRCVSLWSKRIPSSGGTPRASARHTCGSGRCDATWKTSSEPPPPGRRACAHFDGSKSLSRFAFVPPGLLPRRPGGARGPTGLGGVRCGGAGPGREGDGRVASGGRHGLPQPRCLPDRIGPRPAPQPARLPGTDDGPRVPDRAVRPRRLSDAPGLGLSPPEPPPVGRGVGRPGTAALGQAAPSVWKSALGLPAP